MERRTVDARGLLCPRPLIMTKKALTEAAVGEEIVVLIDNETSQQNVQRFLTDNHATVTATREGSLYTLTVTKTGEALPRPDAQSYCTTEQKPHAICIKSSTMGTGDDDLGSILMKAFVNTIKDASPLPATIAFYNGGVHLATEGSVVIDALKDLENRVVKILVCGTCLDYYKKKALLNVGIVSNMYEITQALTDAGHVIYP